MNAAQPILDSPVQQETGEIRLLIADDHQLFIDGLTAILASETHLNIVAQALNGKEVLEAMRATPVDIVLLDINMPDTDIVEVIAQIRKEFHGVKIIIITMDLNMNHYVRLLKSGVDGYMCKSEDKKEIIKGINHVAGGGKYTSSKVTSSLTFLKKPLPQTTMNINDVLTKSELRVLKETIAGLSNSEIGEKLFISKGTVDTHLKNIKAKLGSRNKTELLISCLQYGVLNI